MTRPRSDVLDFGSPDDPCPAAKHGTHVLERTDADHYRCIECQTPFVWVRNDDGIWRLRRVLHAPP